MMSSVLSLRWFFRSVLAKGSRLMCLWSCDQAAASSNSGSATSRRRLPTERIVVQVGQDEPVRLPSPSQYNRSVSAVFVLLLDRWTSLSQPWMFCTWDHRKQEVQNPTDTKSWILTCNASWRWSAAERQTSGRWRRWRW